MLLQLLKRNRRGAYTDGSTNADTFWPAVRLLAVHAMIAAAQIQCCVSKYIQAACKQAPSPC